MVCVVIWSLKSELAKIASASMAEAEGPDSITIASVMRAETSILRHELSFISITGGIAACQQRLHLFHMAIPSFRLIVSKQSELTVAAFRIRSSIFFKSRYPASTVQRMDVFHESSSDLSKDPDIRSNHR